MVVEHKLREGYDIALKINGVGSLRLRKVSVAQLRQRDTADVEYRKPSSRLCMRRRTTYFPHALNI